jgi:arginyl-tRNA synthetase
VKGTLRALLQPALAAFAAERGIPEPGEVPLERARGEGHGDFATPVALGLARAARLRPREVAEAIVARLPADGRVERVEVAGPGFINFHLADAAYQRLVPEILAAGRAAYGRSRLGAGQSIQVEFVSANPTGPLHVGHGRGAAYGAVVAALLEAVGYAVQREYYVNDAGRQMHILAVSTWLRYLEILGEPVVFPVNAYRGEYVRRMGEALVEDQGETLRRSAGQIAADLPADEPAGGDKEAHVDGLIARVQILLGEAGYRTVYDFALGRQLGDIREDLAAFGVCFDRWYSERDLTEGPLIDRVVARLRSAGHAYERDGAVWFRASAFGDEKDRVIVREDGRGTYFASDIAYHMEKLERGFARIIDVWGADHHGYVARVKGAMAALGEDPERLEVLLVQFANLYRGGEKVQMSTRSGSFVTLRELREEVGRDAARFFYVTRRCEQHLDFDLDLAKSQSNDNPVYYVQYAHARVCSVLRQAAERGVPFEPDQDLEPERLVEPLELALLRQLARWPEVVESAALAREPHQIAYYLRETAQGLHAWYNAHTFLVEDPALRGARLGLALATREVLAAGLDLLGVGAPESM